jgi:hypothetical protein
LTNSTKDRLAAASWSLLCALAFSGCSDAPFEMAPVTGRVTIDGQQFSQGKVMFAPIASGKSREAGRPAFGVLQPDGSFELGTYEPGDGAVIGEHWVTVIRIDPEGNADPSAEAFGAPAPKAAGPKQFSRVAVPTKVTVAPEDNVIDVRLSSEEVAKFGVFE